jgi:hypothetical protein
LALPGMWLPSRSIVSRRFAHSFIGRSPTTLGPAFAFMRCGSQAPMTGIGPMHAPVLVVHAPSRLVKLAPWSPAADPAQDSGMGVLLT